MWTTSCSYVITAAMKLTDALEQQIVAKRSEITHSLLSHNPTGRLWSLEEFQEQLLAIAVVIMFI